MTLTVPEPEVLAVNVVDAPADGETSPMVPVTDQAKVEVAISFPLVSNAFAENCLVSPMFKDCGVEGLTVTYERVVCGGGGGA